MSQGRTTPQGQLIWIRAETHVHVGVGQQASVVDLPFAREGSTGYPYIPGSGVKGSLRDAYWLAKDPNRQKEEVTKVLFGKSDDAGKVLFSDARLAFLPVRTMGDTYRYVTSIGLLRRLHRDLEFIGQDWPAPDPTIGDDEAGIPQGAAKVYLEEFPFNPVQCQLNSITGLPSEDQAAVNSRLAILNDNTFDYFTRHGLFVRQRNALDGETKTVKDTALWSEESLPPDTLMYFVLMPRLPDTAGDLDQLVDTLRVSCGGYFQVGGNETVGEGWFKMLGPPVVAAGPGAPQPQPS